MPSQTLTLNDFRTGVDRQHGRYPGTKSLYAAENVVLSSGRHVASRPPIKRLDVELDARSQGLVVVNALVCVVCRSGDDITHDGPDAGQVTNLCWDIPDYAGGDGWELLAATIAYNKVEAWIKHVYPGHPDGHMILKHVLDPSGAPRTKPTYSEDPWCPTNWNADGTRPLHLYGKGEVGAGAPAYTPAQVVASGKLCANRPDGDTAFSISGDPRYWNPFSLADLQDFGLPYYRMAPSGQGTLLQFIIPEDFAALDDDRAWAGYVLEFLDGDGRWQKFTEVGSTPSDDLTYQVIPVDSRFDASNETALVVRWKGDAGTWFRWRAVVGLAPIQLVEGGDLETGYTPASWSQAGDGATVKFDTGVDYDTFRLHYTPSMVLDGLPVDLILGEGMHITIANANDDARIDFVRHDDEIRQLADGSSENRYVTSLRWDAIRYVGAFLPTIWTGGNPANVVPTADYTLTNVNGRVVVTWTANLPADGTQWTIGYLPTASDTVEAQATEVHYTGGIYTFEGFAWEFPAIKLSDMPGDADLLAGIPHFPLLFGSGLGAGGSGSGLYTAAGTYSYVVPGGVTEIEASTWGAGGGGGGGDSQLVGIYRGEAGGGGGGGGEYHADTIPVTPGETLTIVVGAGGSGGRPHCRTFTGGSCNRPPLTDGEDGSDGANTRILRGATVLLEVEGGKGGKGGVHDSSGATGGAGGAGGDSGYQPGADGGTGDARRHITGYGPWQDGGDGGFSGAGDTYGRGGNGSRAQVFNDGCVCSRYSPGDDGNDGRVLIEAKTNLRPWFVDPAAESMPLNGWERYHLLIRNRFTTDAGGAITGEKTYFYGSEAGKESQFYFEKTNAYENQAGADDAGFLASSSKESTGEQVVALSSMQNRLAVHFAESTLLYSFNPDPRQNAFLDDLHFGSRGPAAEFFSGAMVLTQESFKWLSLHGLNWDALEGDPIGDPIRPLDITAIAGGAYWPALGVYVGAVTLDGSPAWAFYGYFKADKVSGWTFGRDRALSVPVVDSMWPSGDRLYFRTGDRARYFLKDPGAGEHYDDVDLIEFEAAQEADPDADLYLEDFKFQPLVRFHFMDLGNPQTLKKWMWMDLETEGSCRAWFYESPRDGARRKKGPTYKATSFDSLRKPLVMRNEGVSVELISDDLDGWRLRQVVLGYKASRR
jgi:hypothetical protein